MYAKIYNGVIKKYPYSVTELKKENPNTSFPANILENTLFEYGVVPVFVTGAPSVDYTKNTTEVNPTFNSAANRWETTWVISDATSEEIGQRIDSQAKVIRAERNALISECDWTQLDDTPLTESKKQEWATYRQELRDIPLQEGFPFNIVWPQKP